MIPTLAAIRFGTGLSPDLPPPDGAADLLARLDGPDEMAERFPVPDWNTRMDLIRRHGRLRRARREDPAAAEEYKKINRRLHTIYHRDLRQTMMRAIVTRDGLRERLTWFWAGHFAVADGGGYLRRSVAAYHDAAIRPHVAGRFGDLLFAAVTHPAMLTYLDQEKSIGPNSPRGRRGGGLNENLAREVLELHTLGAGAPYSQTDVRELAKLLTGLSVTRDGRFRWVRNMVEPGAETVLGETYGDETPNRHDIAAVLSDLAVHPATARHLSAKIARHFIADDPPADLIEAMTGTWLYTDGSLLAVYGAMLDHPAAWAPELRKVRRPLDFMAAALRVTDSGPELEAARGIRPLREGLTDPLTLMGQPWLRPSGPDGWPEEGTAWITPQGLAARLGWAMDLGRRQKPALDPRLLVETALGPLAGDRVRFAAGAAEDRAAGIGLILASPEFQRR
ncbi:DUF1800 domain-containing protein [Jannaschia rubra]|uniref:DUF1800 domain-containing protein n=1 Tax=Jannaschia rubra TaxID=282197 RepID=UPI00249354D0|nr:DUF1800 domain-containing protein [Jannaschia rubra]